MMRPPMLADPGAEAALPAAQGQPATAPMRAYHQDGRIFEQSPDGNWREVQPVASQPIQQADGSMWQQSPTDGAWRQVPAAVPEQPAREPFAMPPARPLQPGEEDGAATFGPKAPGVQQQPVDTLPMDQTGMQPSQQNVWAEFAAPEQPNSPAPQSLISQDMALAPAHPDFKAPPVSTGKKDAKGFVIMSDGSKVDPRDSAAMKSGGGVTQDVMRMTNPDGSKKDPMEGVMLEAIKTFESGTPEQKVALRDKFADPQMLSSLIEQASSGNADAEKVREQLKGSLSLPEVLADHVRRAKRSSSDARQVIGELQKMKEAGVLDDLSYSSAIVSSSGKTAKQIYGQMRQIDKDEKLPQESMVLDSLWDEMGMFDSRPHVRMFQKKPTLQDVISHASMKAKMSRKDAEEWVFNQILGRKYAGKMQKDFESKLIGNAEAERDRKRNEKQDSWKPN
jgi:hypothetical protein